MYDLTTVDITGEEKDMFRNAEQVVKEVFTNELKNTKIKILDLSIKEEKDIWDEVLHSQGVEDAEGIYDDRALPYFAYIRKDSPSIFNTLLHEYFCHGVVAELSIFGAKMREFKKVNYEQPYFDKIYSETKQFILDWDTNDKIDNLWLNNEGVTLWIEHLLLERLDLIERWNKRRKHLQQQISIAPIETNFSPQYIKILHIEKDSFEKFNNISTGNDGDEQEVLKKVGFTTDEK